MDVMIDTGFNGDLLLSHRHREKMNLVPVAAEEFELADGSVSVQRVYLGRITFAGKMRPATVVLTKSRDSLIGSSLMKKMTLTISYPSRSVILRENGANEPRQLRAWFASP